MFGFTISGFFHAFYNNGATHELNGRRPQVGDFFTLPNAGQAFGAAAIVGVALALGYTVCILPVIAVLLLLQFTLFFVIDGGLDAVSRSRRAQTWPSTTSGRPPLSCWWSGRWHGPIPDMRSRHLHRLAVGDA